MIDSLTGECDYCGLPAEQRAGNEPNYCCFGCRFAAAVAAESGEEGQSRLALTRLGLAVFFAMNVMVFTLVLWSSAPDGPDRAASGVLHELLRYAALMFSIPVLFLLGPPPAEAALDNLRKGRITIDGLVVAGVVAAFAYSVVSLIVGGAHVYFEVGCLVLVAFTLGRWLESTGKLKASRALRRLARLLPDKVRRVTANGEEQQVPLGELQVEDRVRVLAGDRVPVDGVVVHGRAAVDERLISGESRLNNKQPGDVVSSGTLSADGELIVQATARPGDGALDRLVDAVSLAAARQGPWLSLADRMARWFTPAVIAIASAAFAGHWAVGGLVDGLLAGLSVLLISCPCALGIALPLAQWIALGRASEVGVLFRGGDVLTRLAGARAVCFDKTGTLTSGEPALAEVYVEADTSRRELFRVANQVAAASNHPFAAAILRYGRSVDPSRPTVAVLERPTVRTFPGRGVLLADPAANAEAYLGNDLLMREAGLATPVELVTRITAAKDAGQSFACLGWGDRVRAVMVFDEQLRDEARTAIDRLAAAGLKVILLTGDHRGRAKRIAEELGISEPTDRQGELLPEDKQAALADVRRRFGCAVMVGDGINDAPALAEADVAIAMGCGADVTRDVGDVCLLGNDLSRIPWSIDLARNAVRVGRLNLAWTLVYNSVGIGLAAAGLLNPVWAAVLMVGSSLFVIVNSLSLEGPTVDGGAEQTPGTEGDSPTPKSASREAAAC